MQITSVREIEILIAPLLELWIKFFAVFVACRFQGLVEMHSILGRNQKEQVNITSLNETISAIPFWNIIIDPVIPNKN